jgi:CAAX protease family protein
VPDGEERLAHRRSTAGARAAFERSDFGASARIAAMAPDDAIGLRPRAIPIGVVIALGIGIPYLAAYAAILSSRLFATPSPHGPTLPWLYAHHAFQLAFALAAIAIVKRFKPFDAGLRRPPGPTYVLPAALWGIFFGVLMTLVDYGPDIAAMRPPDVGFPLTTGNVIGWTVFEGIYVGPTEEIPFRSLLVGYLIAAMPGKMRMGRYTMSWAGIVVAAIFALAHVGNLVHDPSWAAFGQQLYAFALGVLYAYWFENSRSVLAPIVGHNVSDVVEYLIVFALIAAWGG